MLPELHLRPAGASRGAVEEAIRRSVRFLDAHRKPEGSWVGELSSSALATSMSWVALKQHAGHRLEGRLLQATEWLADTQHGDGGWGDGITDASTINSTALATAVLHMADARRFRDRLARAMHCLDSMGGVAAINDPARATLSGPCRTVWAIAGLVPWPEIRSLPVEISLLPKPVRRTVSTTFPAFLSLAMLHDRFRPVSPIRRPLRRLCAQRGCAWLRRAQCSNGGFEESAFLTSIVALCLQATAADDVASRAAAYVEQQQRADGSWPIDRDLETFDSALSVMALSGLGRRFDEPSDRALRDWFLAAQFREVCFPTGAPPGGWAWAQPGGWPDLDDTPAAIRALLRLGIPATDRRILDGIGFLREMQNRDGSWSTFVKNSPMPFDRSCPYITGHVLSAFAEIGGTVGDRTVGRALRFLQRVQRGDGSYEAIWFRNSVAGTASVLEALVALRLGDAPMAHSAASWLCRAQRSDGSWGGDAGQTSTVEETAWACHALTLWQPQSPALSVEHGIDWLIRHQRADGTWPQAVIGLYFSTLWYSDSMYAVALPLRALATYRRLRQGPPE